MRWTRLVYWVYKTEIDRLLPFEIGWLMIIEVISVAFDSMRCIASSRRDAIDPERTLNGSSGRSR